MCDLGMSLEGEESFPTVEMQLEAEGLRSKGEQLKRVSLMVVKDALQAQLQFWMLVQAI